MIKRKKPTSCSLRSITLTAFVIINISLSIFIMTSRKVATIDPLSNPEHFILASSHIYVSIKSWGYYWKRIYNLEEMTVHNTRSQALMRYLQESYTFLIVCNYIYVRPVNSYLLLIYRSLKIKALIMFT